MMAIRIFFAKVLLVLLFFGALYSTVSSVSNITLFDVVDSFAAEEEEVEHRSNNDDLQERKTIVGEKQLLATFNKATYVSTENIASPKTLEEAVDVSRY